MLKRVKRLWELSKLRIEEPDMSEALFSMKAPHITLVRDEPLGDGKAEFLPDMTEEEMIKFEHEEVQGWSKLKRALGL